MTHPLTPRRAGRAVTKFNRQALVGMGAGLGVFVCGAMVLYGTWGARPPVAAKTQPEALMRTLPEVITRAVPVRPVATAVIVQDPAPSIQQTPEATPIAPTTPITPEKPSAGQSLLDRLNPFAHTKEGSTQERTVTSQQAATSPVNPEPPPPPRQTPALSEKPRKGWGMLAQPKEQPQAPETLGQAHLPKNVGQPPPEGQGAQNLIQPARWAMPANPLRTIYRSQTLTGRLLQAIHSDISGQVKIQLTTPVLDKFGYDTTVLPKDTLIIAVQEGRPTYGHSRLALKLEQLEMPSGEVIELRATVGDEAGSHGMKGKVNNHLGKVILATGLSALLNIGVNSAVGTPGSGQFFRTPLQDAAQDVGQAVQREATSIIDRELRIPPTITIPAGTFCTVSLLENMQLNRPPVIAR